jgi:Ni/Fe-hydrogenase 1 B-type cytochrome subunit
MNLLQRIAAKHEGIEQRPARPAYTSPARADLRRVYVWDLVVRVTHWLIALAIFVLAFTGIYIGDPFITSSGEAGQSNLMGTFRTVHFAAAIVFTLAVLVRVYWAFAGSPPARWPNFVPVTAKRRRELKEGLLFYLFLRPRLPATLSHNPVAGLAYLAIYGIYFIMILTGLGLYGASASDSWLGAFAFLGDLFGGLQWARWIHHAGTWLLLGFFVHHLYSSLLAAKVEKNGTVDSIFSGYKWSKKKEILQDDRDGGPAKGEGGEQ